MYDAARNVVSSVREHCLGKSCAILLLIFGSHAYEGIRVARVHWDGRDRHDNHFGTKVHAVHERARREIHVGALDRGESYNQISYEARRTR